MFNIAGLCAHLRPLSTGAQRLVSRLLLLRVYAVQVCFLFQLYDLCSSLGPLVFDGTIFSSLPSFASPLFVCVCEHHCGSKRNLSRSSVVSKSTPAVFVFFIFSLTLFFFGI
jgi:hypothetical protein